MTTSIFPEAGQLIDRLRDSSLKIAFAESCTCGMAAALIGGVPGASDVFCGSAVTYRESVKSDWLGVDPQTLRDFTAESQQTTDEMARRVLARTHEADWGAAITGHLGPHAPTACDGHVFVSLARRQTDVSNDPVITSHTFMLAESTRIPRQTEAAQAFIRWILSQDRLI